ncbi:MAG: ribonuclease HII [Erysipelotrichia bacterium]|nr:ribonuclease HII [Erysipelotrichia bacterium]NCC54240.1 ribonuclease HII [Erysipelotrichia bacterium]
MKCENEFEKQFWQQHKQCVIGLDEAGRGPIAGPLVVAGVVFPQGYEHETIYDSKKISEKKREELFTVIQKEALYYAIEIIDEKTIDEYNIYRATQMIMEKIVKDCPICDAVLSDAMPLPAVDLPMQSLVKGDQKSVSIAAASILAKVTRDRIMVSLDEKYPQYHFKQHKGYPTKQHLQALNIYGVLPIHRKSYGPVKKKMHEQMKFDF